MPVERLLELGRGALELGVLTARLVEPRQHPDPQPDHDRVNAILDRVSDDLYAEIARRFDPTIDDTNLPVGRTTWACSRSSRRGARSRGETPSGS